MGRAEAHPSELLLRRSRWHRWRLDDPNRFRDVQLQSGWSFFVLRAALLLEEIEFPAHLAFVRARNQRGFLGDDSRLEGLDDRLIERLPAQARAGLDDFMERFVFRFAVNNRLARAQAAAHDFGDE